MKNKFRILKILVTVIIFGFLLSFSLKRFNDKPMEKISVKMRQTGERVYFVDEKDVKTIVKKSNPTKKVGDIDIPELEKKLNQLPAVDSANVYLNLNGNLNLDIIQRVPIFRLNKNDRDFYVDEKGTEFPTSKNYSYPCMLVTGNVKKAEYVKLAELVNKINQDDFSKKYFIGISKTKDDYNLLTSAGNFKVELGDLDNIDLKVKGFKAFVEKYLIYQPSEKYTKVSVKYDNQIVTTLNPQFEANDSIIAVGKKELAKLPAIATRRAVISQRSSAEVKKATKKAVVKNAPDKKKTVESPVKKVAAKPKAEQKVTAKTQTSSDKPKARIKVE